jgi:MoaA/NifB/PqqE/SkfB family radical SAM enzyme
MEQVASFGHPAPLFIITGGDPFSRPDLNELIRAGAAAGLGVAVSPSGTPTLTRENLAALHDSGARAISLHSAESQVSLIERFRVGKMHAMSGCEFRLIPLSLVQTLLIFQTLFASCTNWAR